ncbi:ABC transporter permease [Caproiciproducens galactitolivorans]|uniref:ABC transporter permease n=1 Tax=Caproiciproducens galactitolivorans TaxID=642589 RepID=UPI0038B2F6B0
MRRFSFLLAQLVRRDFKIKYRGSILGVLWSVLNPLLNMIVLSIVFSQVFRAVDNYKIYLLSGLVIFNFFSEATNTAMGSVVNNFGLITKVYFPKFILPLSKTLSTAINLVISTVVYIILGCFMGVPIWIGDLLIPFVLVCVLIFCAGVSFILSTLQVFFRDMQYLYGVLLTIWMYSTPIMYPLDIIPQNVLPIFEANPLYVFINFLRQITMYAQIPSSKCFLVCILWAVGTFIAGGIVFVKNQNKFIYYT